jgi:UDP-glucose 6-dehydrogenase
MKISVVGGGYVGLVTGTCFAELGHDVTIIEIEPGKVQVINNGKPPIYEAGLEALLKKNAGKNLRASTGYESLSSAEIVFIAVGTPQKRMAVRIFPISNPPAPQSGKRSKTILPIVLWRSRVRSLRAQQKR